MLDRRAYGDDSTRAFVRAGAGELCPHYAMLNHEVGVAEGSDGDADKEVLWGDVFWNRNSIDLVGLLELWRSETVVGQI